MKVTDRQYALELDKNDPLAEYRSKFVITDPNLCYLDGNSLGRLPHATVKAVGDFLSHEWGNEVVTGWSHWIDEAQVAGDLLGRAVLGAGAGQVLVCDTTSVNFYQLCLAAIHARTLSDNPILLVLSADHMIHDVAVFQVALANAIHAAELGHLATFGVQPTCPETGYGYIKTLREPDVEGRSDGFCRQPARRIQRCGRR